MCILSICYQLSNRLTNQPTNESESCSKLNKKKIKSEKTKVNECTTTTKEQEVAQFLRLEEELEKMMKKEEFGCGRG